MSGLPLVKEDFQRKYKPRKKIRRKEDRERKQRILHCAKRLVQIEAVFNSQVDALLEALELTREDLE